MLWAFFYTKIFIYDMNIFTKIFNGAKEKGLGFVPSVSGLIGRFQGLGLKNEKDIDKYKGWVMRCVQMKADEVASTQLRLYKKDANGKKTEVTEHALLDLIYHPNSEISYIEMMEGIAAFCDLNGDMFWYKAKSGNTTKELWPLRPDWMKVVPSKTPDRLIEGYIYFKDGLSDQPVPMEVEEVIMFRNFNPKFYDKQLPYRGVSTVSATRIMLDEDEVLREWNKNFIKNGAAFDGVLEYDGVLSEEETARFKMAWKNSQSGKEQAGNIPFLQGGMRWKPNGLSQRDMAYIEQKKMNRDDVFGLFGVPKGLIASDDVNLANAKMALWVFTRFTVRPMLKRIESVLNNALAVEYKGLFFEFDNPVPADRAQEITEFTASCNKWMTVNEIREIEGLKPLEGFDEIKAPVQIGAPASEADNADDENADNQDDAKDTKDEKKGCGHNHGKKKTQMSNYPNGR
jgi:HK97 family phage portal protein